MSGRKHEMPDPEELSALLAAVSKEVPGLVKGILDAFFSPDAAANIDAGPGSVVYRPSW